jgi:hypothetical protein
LREEFYLFTTLQSHFADSKLFTALLKSLIAQYTKVKYDYRYMSAFFYF